MSSRRRKVYSMQDDAEDVKPVIQRLPTQPISRTHRAELNTLLETGALRPTTSFCANWSATHNVDPRLVDDWLRRRTGGRGRKENVVPGTDTALSGDRGGTQKELRCELPVNDIHVKRERAESPSLVAPPTKRIKTRAKPHDSQSSTKKASSTRHTRAHDSAPQPGCPTCAQKLSAASTTATPTPARNPGRISAAGPVLKSVLRRPSRARLARRRSRQVRFSDGAVAESPRAYTQPKAQDTPSTGAYTRVLASGVEDQSVSSLPPRFKRKRAAIFAATQTQTGNFGSVTPTASSDPGTGVSAPTFAVRSNVSLVPAVLPSLGLSSVSVELSTTRVSEHRPAVGGASRSPLPSGTSSRRFHVPVLCPSPKRAKLLHTPTDRARPLPVPLSNIASVPPRTPSPRVKIESSFFSPTFFSPSPRSTSPSSDDERALPSSSPPTSPFRYSSPTKGDPHSLKHILPPPIAPTPLWPSASAITNPITGHLPPPEDIPPRARSPPSPDGHPPPSRSGTPQPGRPGRPEADEQESVSDIHGSAKDVDAVGQRGRVQTVNSTPTSEDILLLKCELQELSVPVANEVFVLDDDEDDEPLAVVLARRGRARVKTEEAVTIHNARDGVDVPASSISRPTRQQPPKKRGGGKKKTVPATAGDVAVKTEASADAVAVPAAKAKAKKPRVTTKKAQSKKAVEQVVEKDEDPDVEADVLVPVPVVSWGVADTPSPAPAKGKSKSENARATRGEKMTVKEQDDATTATTSIGATVIPAKQQTKTKGKGKAVVDTPSGNGAKPARRRVSRLGKKHPPRTLVYPAHHLPALNRLVWDEEGFECMELSALPWIAGAGYGPVQVLFGTGDVVFEPSVPSFTPQACENEVYSDVIGGAGDETVSLVPEV